MATSSKTFDYVAAKPAVFRQALGTGLNPAGRRLGRFDGHGIPPDKQGDYAYLRTHHPLAEKHWPGRVHLAAWRAVPGTLRDPQEPGGGLIQAIIGLPANLFYGTGILACIIVIDWQGTARLKGIFMIDASQGFMKDGPKNCPRSATSTTSGLPFTQLDDSATRATPVHGGPG